MKKIFLLILIFLIISLNTESLDQSVLSDDFKEIINIDNENNDFINMDAKDLTYKKMFYYFVLVSEELDKYEIYNRWFQNIESNIESKLLDKFRRVDVANWQEGKQKEFAENLLIFIHEIMFKRYYFYANKISDIINKGEFNCVSSSIIYAVFLKKYGLRPAAVETIDHVFIKILFKNQEIDVETTNRLGFDPGKKKEILDNFGEITGFSYVSPKDYKNRNDIDLKKLLIIVYHNLTNFYMNKGDFLKSAEIGYLIYKGRNDERGKNDFEINFLNYINDLSKKNKNFEAVNTINSYIDYFDKNNKIFDTRFNLLNNYVYYWSNYNNTIDVNNFLLEQNKKYQELKNDRRFIEIYFQFTYKTITFNNKNNNYQTSYNAVKDFNALFKHKDIDKLFSNILIEEMNSYQKTNDYKKIEERLSTLKIEFSEYSGIIKNYEMIYSINKIDFMLSNRAFLNALNEAKKLIIIFPDDQKVKNALLSCYVKLAIYYYENGDIKNVIYYSDEGLKKIPDNRTLRGNYIIFLKNFVNEELNKKNYREARKILNIALEKFPKDSYFVNINNELKSINY